MVVPFTVVVVPRAKNSSKPLSGETGGAAHVKAPGSFPKWDYFRAQARAATVLMSGPGDRLGTVKFELSYAGVLGATEVATGVTAGAGRELRVLPLVEVVARVWDRVVGKCLVDIMTCVCGLMGVTRPISDWRRRARSGREARCRHMWCGACCSPGEPV